MTLSRQLLEAKAKDYEDQYYEEELERLETLPRKFANDGWVMDDLEWIIKWKVGVAFEKPVLRHFRSNDEAAIREAIEEAVSAQSVGERVRALTSLKGIGVPVASAFLLFVDPDRFTLIDVRAWQALLDAGYFDQELSETPTVEEYLLYLGACWALANQYDVKLRTLDMALWALGGEE